MISAGGKGITAATAALTGALLAGAAATGVLPWYVPTAALLIAAAVFRTPRTLLSLLVFLLVPAVSALRTGLTPRPDLGTRDFPSRTILILDDARISAVAGTDGGGRILRAKLREYTDPVTGERRSGGDAPATLILPEGAAAAPCGTVIEAEGAILPIAAADGRDEFLSRIRRRGATAVVRAEKWRRIGRETGLRSLLADGRDAMLRCLFDGVRHPEVRKMAAALYCGVASGISDEVRDDFGAAGIIHIFSVSGIHVAVLALCFAWLLRSLPFRIRYPALAVLVWLYVLTTGAGTPAVRAGVMVTLWALLRVSLLRLRGTDVLSWTATLLLVSDPQSIAEPGAQYSFLITGALLLLSERRTGRVRRRGEADFLPRLFAPWRRRAAELLPARAKALAAGAVTAFLAGAAVSLRTGRHRPGTGAVAANILLALLMPGFFALFFIQLFAGICGAGKFTAPLFERAFLYLRHFAAFFAEHFPDLGAAPPSRIVTLLYILALLTLLRSSRRAVRIGAGVVLAGIAVRQLLLPYTLPPAVLIHSAGYGRPPLAAVADPKRRCAVVVNAPDAGSARRAAEFLRARGIREVEVLTASAPGGVSVPGVAALKRDLKIRRDGMGKRRRKTAETGPFCRMTPLKDGFRLDYFDRSSKLYLGVAVTAGDAGYEAVVERSGKRASRRLPWSIDREEWEYECTD